MGRGEDQERRDVRSEQARAQIADQATNRVHGKDIQSVVNTEQEFQFRSVITRNAGEHAVDDGAPGGHEPRSRCDGDQTGDDAGAEAHGRPFLLQPIVEQTPGDAADTRCQVGDHGSHDGAHRSAQCRTSVEAEPTHPQEDGANDDLSDIMGPEVQLVSAVPAAFAEHQRVCQRSGARRDMHGCPTGEIKATHNGDPAVRVPRPTSNGIVDDGGPEEHENNTGEHAATLCDGANS